MMAEFGSAEIPLEAMCEKFFGLKPDMAKKRAASQRLPIPAYRGGTQKSGWLISAQDLADYIDKQREKARKEWDQVNVA
nr:pyocin activator PrtN family protein [Marinobacter xestospongiae]